MLPAFLKFLPNLNLPELHSSCTRNINIQLFKWPMCSRLVNFYWHSIPHTGASFIHCTSILPVPCPTSSTRKFQFIRTRQYCPRIKVVTACVMSYPPPPSGKLLVPLACPTCVWPPIPWLLEPQIIIKRGLIATLPMQFAIPFTLTIFSDKDNECDQRTPQQFLPRRSCSARLPYFHPCYGLKTALCILQKATSEAEGWLIKDYVHYTIFNPLTPNDL
jgi:hypothetical protein